MEPYQKQLLEKIATFTEENNKILKGIRNHNRWASFFSFLKWLIILAPLVAAYIYLQPYWGSIKIILEKLPEQIKNIEGLSQQLQGAKDFFNNPPKQ